MDVLWPDIPIWEIILRSVSVFLFLLIILRVSGKRDIGEMSPADLILLLLLSANVHTSLSGDDKSILGGLIGATALLTVNYLLNWLAYKNKKFEGFLKGSPEILIYRGKVQEKVLSRHKLTHEQVKIALRKEEISHYDKVRLAVLEPDGTISVFKENTPTLIV